MSTDEGRRAYARLVDDQRRRTFYRHPYANTFLEAGGIDGWIDDLVSAVDNGRFVPGAAPAIEVPKAHFHIRPGLLLSLEDQFVYHLLAMRAAKVIAPQIDWSVGTKRFSHRLAPEGSRSWFNSIFIGWRDFTRASLGRINGQEPTASHVLVADIAGFYDNIDIGRLVQELMAAAVPNDVTNLLSTLWNKWCGVRRRGIPQGLSPSDLFAEFFMNAVDETLSAQKLDHIRYSDDIRIFVSSERSGRIAQQVLERVLRDRGLNLQTAKTILQDAATAVRVFDQVPQALTAISQTMARELREVSAINGGYIDPAELIRILRADSYSPPTDVVERAWQGFVDGEFGEFNKTVFHYLLARLAEMGSGAAQGFCVDLLESRPEETEEIVKYFAKVSPSLQPATVDRLVELVIDDEKLFFVHQRYHLLQWFLDQSVVHEELLNRARFHSTGAMRTVLLPYWIAYVGEVSDSPGDFAMLEAALGNETDSVNRATYLYALRRAPAVDRDLLYSRCRGEARIVDGAIALARVRSP